MERCHNRSAAKQCFWMRKRLSPSIGQRQPLRVHTVRLLINVRDFARPAKLGQQFAEAREFARLIAQSLRDFHVRDMSVLIEWSLVHVTNEDALAEKMRLAIREHCAKLVERPQAAPVARCHADERDGLAVEAVAIREHIQYMLQRG